MYMDLVPSTSILLQQKALYIDNVKEIPNNLIFSMFYIMDMKGGIGLSGCQIGYPYQIFATNVDSNPLLFINPEITWYSSEKDIEDEGCLSFPGVRGAIKRSRIIKIKARNASNEEFDLTATELLSRCIQHEFDHLQGIVFTSKFEIQPTDPVA